MQAPSAAVDTTPSAPATLTNATGNYWVNYTWTVVGSGAVTDGYNVSMNGSWYNRTTTSLNSSVGAGNWSNITVWAWNATGNGNMSVANKSDTVQAPSAAPQNANIVSIANVTLPYGSTQTVPIRLLNSTGVGAVTVNLTFDPSIVNATNAVAGDFSNFSRVDYSNVSEGILRINCMEDGVNLTGDRTIATVTLHAVNMSGSCGLNLSAELFMADGSDVSSTVSNGTFTVNTTEATTPPTPVSLQSTTGKYWVNYTWSAGSPGPDTNGYNVSLDNGSWYNRTTTSLNVTGLGAEGWANITVWAFNETGSGNMSVSGVSDEVQAPADTVTVTITLRSGWNLIGIPVYPLNNTVASVFDGVEMAGASVYTYVKGVGYQVVTTVEPKVGYWVFSFNDNVEIIIEGTPVTS